MYRSFHPFCFCSSLSLCCTNQEQTFRLLKSSRTMVNAVSLLMLNSSAINLSVSHRPCASICRTFSIISGVLLDDGRPERGSSSIVSSLRERVNTFSAHGFSPVQLHVHFTRLRSSFPQIVAEHAPLRYDTTSHTDFVQLAEVGLHCRSHAAHAVSLFSPCL